MTYKDDKLNGKSTTYYPGKGVMSESYYNNGRQHGVWKIYNEKGEVIKKIEYQNGVRKK
jgi:antitoxin component YwqK of YwqJK toxin-antitoxin module